MLNLLVHRVTRRWQVRTSKDGFSRYKQFATWFEEMWRLCTETLETACCIHFQRYLPLFTLTTFLIYTYLILEGARGGAVVAGSTPDGVTGIFHWHNPSGRTMALGSTQTVTEMSTRNVSWGQRWPVRRADNLATFMCRLSSNLEPSGPVKVCNGIALPLPLLDIRNVQKTCYHRRWEYRSQVRILLKLTTYFHVCLLVRGLIMYRYTMEGI
jgi:hypothetical protein